MSETITCPVALTQGAANEFKRLLQEKQLDENHGVRVGVKGGGCAGFSYVLGFDTAKQDDDVFELDGLKVVLNKAHALYLMGVELDFQNDLNSRGFVFNNPNADKTCGCGTSFSA